MPAKIHLSNVDDLIEAYLSGTSLKKLADQHRISPRVIGNTLVARGVQLRGRSEAEFMKWSLMKTDRARVERQVGAAWSARRGQTDTPEVLAARAQGKMKNLSATIGRGESTICTVLEELGVSFIRQSAFERYNIDIALKAERIAVEVVGAWPTRDDRKIAFFHERTKRLLDAGWCVLFLYVGPVWGGRFVQVSPTFIRDELASLVERARRNEPIHGRYRVVRCDAKPTAILRKYLHDLPLVE